MDDLKQLASMLPLPLETPPPPEVRRVVTSLKASARDRLLQDLPDHECAEFVGRGLKEGFRIGFDRRKVKCHSAKHNMLSVESNPAVVNEYLAKEMGHGSLGAEFQITVFPTSICPECTLGGALREIKLNSLSSFWRSSPAAELPATLPTPWE